MEIIKFRVIQCDDDMYRIETNDYRTIYKNIADGTCCSTEIMLAEIERITKEVHKLGNNAVFTIEPESK